MDYSTGPGPACSALAWLQPEQTAGGRHPYVFSQCQAIHARSLLPCQDSPAVKAPYTASVTAPAALTVLMVILQLGTRIYNDLLPAVASFMSRCI